MKLSVLDLVPVLGDADSATALKQAAELAGTAEQLGYHRYWAAEHHDLPHLACPAPEVLLAYIGARTHRIRLGSGALLLPHYSPMKVAETFRLLAALCPGRIDLGIGRAPGGSAHVSIALSGNFLENVRKMPETLETLAELLTDRYRLDGQSVTARPIPPSPPEIWMLGTNHRSAAYASKLGAGYVFGHFMSDRDGEEVLSTYRKEFQPSSLTPEPRAMAAVSIICAETEEKAYRLAAEGRARFEPKELPKDGAAREHQALIGTPEQVKAGLLQYRDRYRVEEFLVVTLTGDYESRLHSYKLLAEACL